MYSKQDCIDSLVEASKTVPHSISQPEYDELDISPSSRTIKRRFGGWNNAKSEAGLSTNERYVKHGCELNESYFKKLDSESSYWLGMLYGDGTIYKSESGTWKVQLALIDKEHIKKYREAISSTHKITHADDKAFLPVTNEKFGSHLVNHGMDSNKTFSNSLPDLTEKSKQKAFIRGLSDADGHIGERQWTIAGSNVNRFEKLSKWIPFDCYVHDRDVGGCELIMNGVDKLTKFYGWLYSGSPALTRKEKQATKYARRNR